MWLPAISCQHTKGDTRHVQTTAALPLHFIFRVRRGIFPAWISTWMATLLNKEKHSHLPNLTSVTSISQVNLCASAAGRCKIQTTRRYFLIVFKAGSYGFESVQIQSIGPLDKLKEIEVLLDLIKYILS